MRTGRSSEDGSNSLLRRSSLFANRHGRQDVSQCRGVNRFRFPSTTSWTDECEPSFEELNRDATSIVWTFLPSQVACIFCDSEPRGL